jgi:glycosyltransferase involved in cell wall biosynthesis
MAVFNTAAYLQEALASITSQSFQDFELVVLDDGSTDGSTQLLRNFANKEQRMRLIVRENRGLIATRNELLGAAKGKLIAWMDSDDISLPNRLSLQVSAFDADPELVCLGGSAQCVDPHGQNLNIERYPLTHGDILIDQQKGGAMRFPTTMMRRDFARQVGGFREPFKIGEDFDLLLRLSEVGKMANLPMVLYLYRQHLGSVCASLGPRWPIYRDQILALAHQRRQQGHDQLQLGEHITISEPIGSNTKQLESQTYVRWAHYAMQNDNWSLAWKYAGKSVLGQPTSKTVWKSLFRALLSYPLKTRISNYARRAISNSVKRR